MTKTDLRRIRLRFLVAPLLVLACALFCSVYIRKTSSTYDYPLTGFGDAVAHFVLPLVSHAAVVFCPQNVVRGDREVK